MSIHPKSKRFARRWNQCKRKRVGGHTTQDSGLEAMSEGRVFESPRAHHVGQIFSDVRRRYQRLGYVCGYGLHWDTHPRHELMGV